MLQSWFSDAKLGIFIHWGIYSVLGIDESWAFHNGKISHADYMRQLEGFTASKWEPGDWAELFVKAGATYAVMTAKHHDGVALFDTNQITPSLRSTWPIRGLGGTETIELGHEDDSQPLSTVFQTPANRDCLSEYLSALRTLGLRTGVYFSHLDWSHGNYASPSDNGNAFEFSNSKADPNAWNRFKEFHHAQLQEICTKYGDIDLLWFDGDWEGTDEDWEMYELRDQLLEWQPNVVLNSRLRGHGDYETPEQGLPIVAPAGPWEFCMTINNSWGYQPNDKAYKSPRQILHTFCDVIGLGGNLLLDIGPMECGTIPPEQVASLEHLGSWIKANAESVYGTVAGLPHGHYHGTSTQSKDGKTIFLHVRGDGSGETSLRGCHGTPVKVTLLDSGKDLKWKRLGGADWMSVPGVIWIELPSESMTKEITVIKVEFEQPPKLYRGQGQGISQN